MRSPWWLVCVLWAVSAVALGARKPAPGQAEAEAGIHVAGTIVVGPEGKPLEYELTGANRLPAEVRRLLDFHIPRWEFEPTVVDRKSEALRILLGLYQVASPRNDDCMRCD